MGTSEIMMLDQTRVELVSKLLEEVGLSGEKENQYLTRDELVVILTVVRLQKQQNKLYQETLEGMLNSAKP